jgi:hypothetical protein
MKWKLGLLLVLLFGLAVGIMITIRINVSPPPQTKTKRASDFRANSEPAGFRGIPWMIDLSKLSHMKQLPSDLENYKLYERIGEEKKIGQANVQYIQYWTFHDKFVKVDVSFDGQENWDIIKKITFERFGPARKSIELDRVYYSWDGKDVSVSLVFDTKLKYGGLHFMHNYILEVLEDRMKKLVEAYGTLEQIREKRKKLEEKMRKLGIPTDTLEDF